MRRDPNGQPAWLGAAGLLLVQCMVVAIISLLGLLPVVILVRWVGWW